MKPHRAGPDAGNGAGAGWPPSVPAGQPHPDQDAAIWNLRYIDSTLFAYAFERLPELPL